MIVGFTATCEIRAYHHLSCEFESSSWRGVLDKTLCDKVCQWLAAGQWFSLGTTVSSTNKIDFHDITEMVLKVALHLFLNGKFEFCFYNLKFKLHLSYITWQK